MSSLRTTRFSCFSIETNGRPCSRRNGDNTSALRITGGTMQMLNTIIDGTCRNVSTISEGGRPVSPPLSSTSGHSPTMVARPIPMRSSRGASQSTPFQMEVASMRRARRFRRTSVVPTDRKEPRATWAPSSGSSRKEVLMMKSLRLAFGRAPRFCALLLTLVVAAVGCSEPDRNGGDGGRPDEARADLTAKRRKEDTQSFVGLAV